MIIDFLNIFEHPGADILTWMFGSFDTTLGPRLFCNTPPGPLMRAVLRAKNGAVECESGLGTIDLPSGYD